MIVFTCIGIASCVVTLGLCCLAGYSVWRERHDAAELHHRDH